MITSSSNSRIKNIIRLQKSSKARKEQGVFVLEGIKMFAEAAECSRVREVYVSESFMALYGELLKKGKEAVSPKENSLQAGILAWMKRSGDDWLSAYNIEMVGDEVFQRLSDTVSPQGILAVVDMPERTFAETGNILVLDGVQDPGNLGTILRTAEAADIAGVILSKDSADVFNPKVIRATMGGIFRVPFRVAEDIAAEVAGLKKTADAGGELYTVYGAALGEGCVEYTEPDYTKPSVVVIGNEAKGISVPVMNILDKRVQIPMSGNVESLNAAVAASVLMFEMARQRRLGGACVHRHPLDGD